MEDVLLTPRPFLRQPMLRLDCQQEAFNPPFEAPKAGPAEQRVLLLATLEEGEETDCVEGRVVPAEVSGSLLVGLGVMDVVVGVVCVRDERGEGQVRGWGWGPADVVEGGFQYFVPKFSDFGRDDGDF